MKLIIESFAGSCRQLECIAWNKGKWRNTIFPSLFAVHLHPKKGLILIDTGYSEHNFEQIKIWPYKLYNWLVPINLERNHSAKAQILDRGYSISDVSTVILTHFHADHIGGCLDFDQADFYCSGIEYKSLQDKQGFSALKKGFIPALLPDDFDKRSNFIEHCTLVEIPQLQPIFPYGYDLFDDASVIAIPMLGHSLGQFGILTGNDFYIADSCWTHQNYERLELPSRLSSLIHNNWTEYIQNIYKIHRLKSIKPHINIILSHAGRRRR